ncbi:MAG: hypothetical protein TE42_00915 [Candidatus Synechococcus spongiarum SP3]|uniref:Uncharacterized protein n=1 Tax=Candidatus Synechococcus spongiarum SP3 TaxID=1604020 RepID=A0A0G2HN12_9SYNE|nr:MAG: hypothetical protein TE42_00915 [Candidatus Synechococcus spongiarum SP3]
MPSLPPELGEWLAPSVFLAVLGLILGLQGKRIDEQGRRIDELRADLKASEARQQQDMKELRAEMKEGFAQCRAEQREDNRALNEKLDRLVEALLTAQQS